MPSRATPIAASSLNWPRPLSAAFPRKCGEIRDGRLAALARYLECRPNLTRDEFSAFALPLLRTAEIQFCEWIPCVPAAQKAAVEAAARRGGQPEFSIFEFNARRQRVPAAGRAVHFPVLYVEPLEGNRPAVGFDLGSEAVRRETLAEIATTGLLKATLPVALISRRQAQTHILLLYPVRASAAASGGPAAAEVPALRGFALVALRLNALLADALAPSHRDEMQAQVDLFELSAGRAAEWLAAWPRPATGSGDSVRQVNVDGSDFAVTYPFFMYGRTYAAVVRPGALFQAEHGARAGWIVGLAGLLLSVVLTLLAHSLANRRADLEAQIQLRTVQLRTSEESYRRQFADNLAMMVLIDPADGRIIDINAAAANFYGYTLRSSSASCWRILAWPCPRGLSRFSRPCATAASAASNPGISSATARSATSTSLPVSFRLATGRSVIASCKTSRIASGPRPRGWKSAQLRRALLDNSAVAIFLASPQRVILEANARAGAIFGYEPGELQGQSFRAARLAGAFRRFHV